MIYTEHLLRESLSYGVPKAGREYFGQEIALPAQLTIGGTYD